MSPLPPTAPVGAAPRRGPGPDLGPDLDPGDGTGDGTEVDLATCWRLLSGVRRVRVAYTSGALPALDAVPVVLDGSTLVLLARAGSTLARAAHGGVVAVQADGGPVPVLGGPSTAPAPAEWSVTVTGRAEVVDVDGGLAAAMARTGVPRRPGEVLVRVHADIVEGRRR
ncbi:pyridoxamine 5'-phosphate oxidase family protein [uncultured Pseudokineococcus sp.]|uniref:pyridoxamine 5'-phosphate oxidase family protein n=1 Tax=uncultured Pseudokineococcus sp. TaxID=1642928 RepID=UPI0026268F6D|nr:pyridoxamine 5'-phosphate oxidase family protein [uncultured Pseudokineococcus sp.]